MPETPTLSPRKQQSTDYYCFYQNDMNERKRKADGRENGESEESGEEYNKRQKRYPDDTQLRISQNRTSDLHADHNIEESRMGSSDIDQLATMEVVTGERDNKPSWNDENYVKHCFDSGVYSTSPQLSKHCVQHRQSGRIFGGF